VHASPARQSAASRGSASSGVAPAISWRAMRMMLRRAAAVERRAPNGTRSATSSPRPRARGTSTPAKYSLRWRSTSASSRQAGKTSTKRKSSVLKPGCDIAQSSTRSLQRPR